MLGVLRAGGGACSGNSIRGNPCESKWEDRVIETMQSLAKLMASSLELFGTEKNI